MEKRAIEDAKVKMAQTEQDAERARLAEEKRLLEKIETGGGKCLYYLKKSRENSRIHFSREKFKS